MIELAALAIVCMVRGTPAAIDDWLRRRDMRPAITLYSGLAERRATIWMTDGVAGGERYAMVVRLGAKACVVDMGRDWREAPKDKL